MSNDVSDEEYNKYVKDPRIACQYGIKCFQKNEIHLNKYKHPPKTSHSVVQKKRKRLNKIVTGQRRKAGHSDIFQTPPGSPQTRHHDEKQDEDLVLKTLPSSVVDDIERISDELLQKDRKNEKKLSLLPEKKVNSQNSDLLSTGGKPGNAIVGNHFVKIPELFLINMPGDFYQFYEFCKNNAKEDISELLKSVDLELVGPFDVLLGKFSAVGDADDCLRHWRYYYDPPEFQTVLKGNDKDGLHYGYWRDEPKQKPVFVAKNNAEVSCKIIPVGENLFGAVNVHIEEKMKSMNPFERIYINQLHQKLKSFAKEKNITLSKNTPGMKERERKVVARTFHGAGIVVPYDKKTQVGYRKLTTSDTDLQEILRRIKRAESDNERKKAMTDLQEIMRWAIIAADECDFGTCLELGHDLFSSGVIQVKDMTLQMLEIVYNQLDRSEFLKIAEVHLNNRKSGSSLSIL